MDMQVGSVIDDKMLLSACALVFVHDHMLSC